MYSSVATSKRVNVKFEIRSVARRIVSLERSTRKSLPRRIESQGCPQVAHNMEPAAMMDGQQRRPQRSGNSRRPLSKRALPRDSSLPGAVSCKRTNNDFDAMELALGKYAASRCIGIPSRSLPPAYLPTPGASRSRLVRTVCDDRWA